MLSATNYAQNYAGIIGKALVVIPTPRCQILILGGNKLDEHCIEQCHAYKTCTFSIQS